MSDALPEREACLPSIEKLRRSPEVKRVLQQGKSWVGRYMVLKLVQDAGLPDRKMAVIASRKVGGAVRRNRAKRRLRTLYRTHRRFLPGCGIRLVLIARFPLVDVPFPKAEKDFRRLLTRAGLFTGPEPCGGWY